MVGSSWNSAEVSGEAPTRSPAATVIESSAGIRAWRSAVARYSMPPAGVLTGWPVAGSISRMVPEEPAGGSRLPCRSLMASNWRLTVLGFLAVAAWAADGMATVPTRPAAATTANADRRVLTESM